MQKTLLIIAGLGLSACMSLQRDPRSGYSIYEESTAAGRNEIYESRKNADENDAREELGLLGRGLTPEERSVLEQRIRLKRLEGRLNSKRDKRQYYQIRSHLRNDRERLYFLSLPTYEARERWAGQRGLMDQDDARSEDVAKTIEANAIALGMSQKAVMES